MPDQELMLDLTRTYLRSVVSDVSNSLNPDFDPSTSFMELGIDSFHILKVVKRLEADFGSLPKTLLFENFTVDDLASYFVSEHEQVISAKFSHELRDAGSQAQSFGPEASPTQRGARRTVNGAASPNSVETNTAAGGPEAPTILAEKEAHGDPFWGGVIREIFHRYKNESSASRGTPIIAPTLFIGSARRGYFNVSRGKGLVLVYAYTGPENYFQDLAQEVHAYCAERKLQLNMLVDLEIRSIGDVRFSATPFSVVQRLRDLSKFTLQGGRMRRLRYLVSKFKQAGDCRTEEYRCGSDRETDRSIVRIIDQWCSARTMVNPLIHAAREEILAGTFSSEHRVFLTYTGEVLQNAIIISPLSSEQNGYLMDLEFYPLGMPLGGLEFAIVNIIETLVSEGSEMLSLGATLGKKLAPSSNADPEVDRILDDLRKQDIFNDQGNFQFKNKFRPDNKTIFLCRPEGSGHPDNVTDIIMMIADPERAQSWNAEQTGPGPAAARTRREERAESATPAAGEEMALILSGHGYNPLNVPDDEVDVDLKTDSWSELRTASIDRHVRDLHAAVQYAANVGESLRALFPFTHFVLTSSGRTAEDVFCRTWPRKGIVPQNLLFPTTIYHQIDKGFTPEELPCAEVFQLYSDERYKGELDWDALRKKVECAPEAIAFVCVEVNNNAAGGHPVSIRHLKSVRALLSEHAIPLVIDGTRIVGNARFLMEHDRECASKDIWEVVREVLSCADAVVASLTKEFCVARGGMIATNDAELFSRLEQLTQEEASGLDVIDKSLIAVSLQNRRRISAQVTRRMECVRRVWKELTNAGIPVVQPAGGHCVLIDVGRIPEFQSFEHPVASFLAWMYLNTGIRAAAHNAGMQQKTALNGLVRLAIPVGLGPEQVESVTAKLIRLFETKANIPELLPDGEAPAPFGNVNSRFRLRKYHNRVGSLIARTPDSASPRDELGVPAQTGAEGESPASAGTSDGDGTGSGRQGKPGRDNRTGARCPTRDIAIVGAAGRYPEARNLKELWSNLSQGRDSIRDIPDSRMERRRHNGRAARYRGGFIDDIDKFDSLFFNISPREAEMLDPQERLFLEVAWEAIEDAGYYPEALVPEGAARDVGVFVGAVWAMYQMIGVEEKLSGRDINPNSFLWSIANRVSYWMNFSGPSLTVDTACSSSLTALYLACEALRKGECSAAIVGGVNLDLHQSKYDINWAGGALSKDGVCRSFGQGANGYVAGEGVGAILLKPLQRAVEDDDNIQGVIKSAVLNHGGRTSGYTVPNSRAQAKLISQAIREAQIDPRTIGYIEAHGTGTELGDPIEVAGLTEVFQAHGAGNQALALGSIKSNIGHLEAAAGVVSVCKVLLQMKHRRLVPSLHSSELNEHIDFDNLPFYVQQELDEWQPREVDGVLHPLRAGVSSFGAGGSNAHVILENHEPPEQVAQTQVQIVPLSANTEQQLREAAIRLRQCVREDLSASVSDPQFNVANIAYTLQVGRKSFDHRMAVLAATKEELVEKLTVFIEGRKQQGVLHGNAEPAARITKLLSSAERKEFLELLASREQLHRLAELWTEGLLTDWEGHHDQVAGKRISLPTYPFAGKRHWARTDSRATGPSSPVQQGLHPLIDSNESTFERQLFRKTFNTNEFFIYDHHVSDIPTLPGVAYLELARKAGELAAGRRVRKIRNIVWVSPLTVEDSAPTQAVIDLKSDGESVQFEVFSEEDDGSKRLYSQGKLEYEDEHEQAEEAEFVDLDGIRARCTKVSDGSDIYPMFKSLGLNLGPNFQVLQEVFRSETEVLGVLKLPDGAAESLQEFMLHPSLVDGSFQAGMGARLQDKATEMFVPYSIGEVEIMHPLEQACFSYVTEGKGDEKTGAKLARSNVLILDAEGKVLVKVRDSVGVPLLDVHEKAEQSSDQEPFSTLYYSYVWEKASLDEAGTGQSDAEPILLFDSNDRLRSLYRDRLERTGQAAKNVILVQPGDGFRQVDRSTYQINPGEPDHYDQLVESLQESDRPAIKRVCFAWGRGPSSLGNAVPDGNSLGASLDRGIYTLLFFCQSLVDSGPKKEVQIVYLHGGHQQDPDPQDQAVNGFANTLHVEYPKLSCKTVHVQDRETDADDLLDLLLAEFRPDAKGAMTVRYGNGERHARRVESFDLEAAEGSDQSVPLKENGVYLITGGAGGLGHAFAEFLSREFKARVVLNGRSALNAEIEAELATLREAGAEEALYLSADVSRPEEAGKLIADIKSQLGAIDGILHMAGVLRDSYIKDKLLEDFDAVLAPKVYGTVNLDDATKSEDLDFVALFSSMTSLGGNPGQCDYAFANHFMDSFAETRESLRANGSRTGKTLSINWSIWADGGMTVDEQTELYLKKNLGIKPIDRDTGLNAFVRGLGSSKCQFAVVEGVREKVERAWGLTEREAPAERSEQAGSSNAETDATAGELPALVQNGLAEIVMEFLKLDPEDISLDKILLDLGFDSIGLATYANLINEKYQLDITPVLFFEYPSIREIANHLSTEHRDAVLRVHADSGTTGTPAGNEPASRLVTDAQTSENSKVPSPGKKKAPARATIQQSVGRAATSVSPGTRFAEQPIAIVGMSGVMPQSENREEFWDNLQAGRNLVTTIPKDRWSWEEYDGNPLTEVNKTNSRWGGFMKEVDKFDPLFFGISPREAELMDPQQRIFLETVWNAIEDSGHKVSDLWGTKTGLFVGVATNDYVDLMTRHRIPVHAYASTGNSHSVLVNRVSYLLNLRGPSAPLDTACSSSLVALHRAIESIHTGSCDMAIVGGVQVMTSPTGYIAFGQAGMLSSDGKCKTFDKGANGYVRGEGSGAILLKPLAMAQADRDPIHAVIKATAENHGGNGTALTAPNPSGQAELLIDAFETAQVDPGTVGYVECHGTGTSLGDPIEIQALKKSFAELYKRHGRPAANAPHCGLSSVKTNIGHLETAAGIAGVLKAVLAIKHRQIPALIHFEEVNPYIDLEKSPFYIVDRTQPWEAPTDENGAALPRTCGVSSFGFGGANAHVVLEEYRPPESQSLAETRVDSAVVLSARSGDRLDAYARALLAHLQKHAVELPDLAYTLQVGRDAFEERVAFRVSSVEQLLEKLQAFIDGVPDVDALYRGNANLKNETMSAVGRDDSVRQDAINEYLADGNIAKLMELWVNGVDLDWNELYDDIKPRRVSLPTYPFARERFWIDTTTSSEPVGGEVAASAVNATAADRDGAETGNLLAVPVWQAGEERGSSGATSWQPAKHYVLICAMPGVDDRRLEASIPRSHCVALESAGQTDAAGRYRQAARACFELIQSFFSANPKEQALIQVVVPDTPENALLAGLSGLLKTAASENFRLTGQIIRTGQGTTTDELARQLKDALARPHDTMVRYEGGIRNVLTWEHMTMTGGDPAAEVRHDNVFKEDGVYLITGGLGGLGVLFAREIQKRAGRPTLILTGRSKMSAAKQSLVDELSAGSGRVEYRQVDAADAEQVEHLIATIGRHHSALNGILHCAGATGGQLIVNDTLEEIDAVLAPKVSGTVNLDEATRKLELDFFVLFSSISSVIGTQGFAAYAAANAFMDQFAGYRNWLASSGERQGRTVAINWPLWKEGGMSGDVSWEREMRRATGMQLMRSATGIAAFYRSLELTHAQTLVLEGDADRMTEWFQRTFQRKEGPQSALDREGRRTDTRGNGRSTTSADGSRAGIANVSDATIEKLTSLIRTDLQRLQEGGR